MLATPPIFEPSSDPTALRSHLETLNNHPKVGAILILTCDANGYTPEQLDPMITTNPKPVVGGVFPSIIAGRTQHERGSLILGLSQAPHVTVIDQLSQRNDDFDACLEQTLPLGPEDEPRTLMVFIDGFCPSIGTLIDALFDNCGLDINYLGGGCGSLSLVQRPCVITPQGLKSDSALLLLFRHACNIGMSHGWTPISRLFKVTESHGNTIISLDWRPAFEVYRDVIEEHGQERFSEDNFFSIAKSYPFGISRLDSETIVRDPLAREGNLIHCIAEVPQGTFIRVLHGNHDSLLKAASAARTMAESTWTEQHPDGATPFEFVVDCVSRALFFGDQFHRELNAVCLSEGGVGTLTLGEIANSGQDYLEFYNKTVVVGLF